MTEGETDQKLMSTGPVARLAIGATMTTLSSPPPGGNLPRRAPLESVPRASVARLCEALVGIELGEVSLAGRGGTGWRVHGGRRRGL